MPGLPCAKSECPNSYVTPEGTMDQMLKLLEMHMQHNHSQRAATATKAPSITRPTVEPGISEEEWQVFTRKWEMFSVAAGLDKKAVSAQLFSCCDPTLQDILLKDSTTFNELDEENAIEAIMKMAVVPVAIGVRRAELLAMGQDAGEGARAYHARVKGKAAVCNNGTTTKCTCLLPVKVNFTDVIIKDVFVSGLSDEEIKRETLGWTNLDKSSIQDTVQYVKSKEMARNALAGTASLVSATSLLKSNKKTPFKEKGDERTDEQSEADLRKSSKCPDCGNKFFLLKKNEEQD